MWQGARRSGSAVSVGAGFFSFFFGEPSPMVKPEWGTKRTCPKCAARFYDLGKDDPIHCIACGVAWQAMQWIGSSLPRS